MTDDTPGNGQLADSVSQVNIQVLGCAPAMSLGTTYQALGHSTALLFESAVAAQQNLAVTAQAAANQGIIQLYTIGTMAGAAAFVKITKSDTRI